jgi:serine/threonine-protein kinase
MSPELNRRVVGRAPSTNTSSRTPRETRWELPADLQRQASHRLGIISLITAGVWIVGTVLYHYLDRVLGAGDMAWMGLQPSDAIVAAGALLSLGMYAYTRRSRRSPGFILDLGLVYMVATAFIAGLIVHWEPMPRDRSMAPTISWIGVMVLLYSATLPSRPLKIVAAGLLAVSMNPIGMLIARARGLWPFERAGSAFLMHYPDLLIVVMSAVIVQVVFGLSRQVAKARELGSYQLGELIGRGGMGEVYRATHRMLARPAAIKLMRPELLAPHISGGPEMAAERFRREARAAANLRSPHTVELYDFGVTDDGTLYFAMELLDGLDLESLVRTTGPMPAARTIAVLAQVCESLEEAHANGLVHRDIKPGNIHVGRLGLRHDFVKVLDFGLVTAPAQNVTLATAAGVVPGTPAYMAPEMALGETIDGRADLYALGCVAYFVLTGRAPFEASGPLQTIMRRLREEPVAPSTQTDLPIPPELDEVVLACLATDRGGRPADAADLQRRLRSIPIEAWTQEMAAAWWAVHQPDLDRARAVPGGAVTAPPAAPATVSPVTTAAER